MKIAKKLKNLKNVSINFLQLFICGSRYLMHIILCIDCESLMVNSTLESRLVGLALLSVHRNIEISDNRIFDIYIGSGKV
jgi:hypothetical protein